MAAKRFMSARERILSGASRSMNAVVTAYQAVLVQVLSQHGTGRFYARSKATRAVSSGFPTFELSRQQVKAIVRAEVRRSRAARGSASRRRNLQTLGVHQASAPGKPPAVDTGTLQRSWQVGLPKMFGTATRLGLRLGTRVKYARWLQYGTRRMRARPSVDKAKQKLIKSGAIRRIVDIEMRRVGVLR